MEDLRPGTYRHYKGNDYEVIGVARHSETEEPLVVYRALYGDRGLWVRPLEMFRETVLVDGAAVPRFRLREDGVPRPPELTPELPEPNHERERREKATTLCWRTSPM